MKTEILDNKPPENTLRMMEDYTSNTFFNKVNRDCTKISLLYQDGKLVGAVLLKNEEVDKEIQEAVDKNFYDWL